MSNDGSLDLFDGLDSGTALFLLENFRIIVKIVKSSEDNEGSDSILL